MTPSVTTTGCASFSTSPAVWGAIRAPERFIEDNYEGDGCYGAMGADIRHLEDSEALKRPLHDLDPGVAVKSAARGLRS